jgi:hypothetical protein
MPTADLPCPSVSHHMRLTNTLLYRCYQLHQCCCCCSPQLCHAHLNVYMSASTLYRCYLPGCCQPQRCCCCCSPQLHHVNPNVSMLASTACRCFISWASGAALTTALLLLLLTAALLSSSHPCTCLQARHTGATSFLIAVSCTTAAAHRSSATSISPLPSLSKKANARSRMRSSLAASHSSSDLEAVAAAAAVAGAAVTCRGWQAAAEAVMLEHTCGYGPCQQLVPAYGSTAGPGYSTAG